MIRSIYFLGTLLVTGVLMAGCVIQPAIPSATTQASVSVVGTTNTANGAQIAAYKLKPSDPINIRFSGIQELQGLDVVIDENGEINLLHIDTPVKAAGLTTSQLEDKIERLYLDGGIYKTLSVNVTMTAKMYYVQGEVMQPGQFQLTSGTTLLQAIAGARGFSQFANPRKVTITRQGKIYKFNMKEIERDPSQDVKIEAGDVIKVWQSWY